MTTFISDGNDSVFTASHIIDFDPADFGLPPDKHDGSFDGRGIHPDSRANATNASFDEASTSTASTRSDTSGTSAVNDNNRTSQTSMASLANGSAVVPDGKHGLENGDFTTLVDRTVRSTTVISDHTVTADDADEIPPEPTAAPPPPPPPPSSSPPQPPSHIIQHSISAAVEDTTEYSISTASAPPPPTSLPPPPPTSALNPPSPSSIPPSTQPPDVPSQVQTGSPRRLSSPPHHLPSTSAPALSTPQAPAQGQQLRQRHTLEVPRKQPRGSRDSADAFTSGRFSPTAAGSASARRASLSLGRRNTRSMQSDLPRDEVAPDEDALRWAEAYRQKRASKRRRREEEDDDRVLVGTKVDEHHVNWVTAYNMLTGIRVSVSRTNAKLHRDVTDADFDVKQKSTFDIAGNELVPSAKYDFKFKDYAPWVFRCLRGLFRLDPADYLMSLTGKYILSELGSPGKSGSFFYYSRDYKYIIKTIHHAEHKYLRRILKDYYHHVTQNPNTLLSQFYGLHRVKMPYGKKIHFVVMNNLFPPHRDIHQTFDLKGSTVGRDLAEDSLEENPRGTLKDLNWMRRKRSLEFGVSKKRMFLDQLQRDVALLKRLNIMDYSLLIGIHDLRKGNEENLRDRTLQVFNPGGEPAAEEPDMTVLLRTPSKLESAKKARELRQKLRQERPVPMDQSGNRMPDELEEGQSRPGLFNQDDGGYGATHADDSPADEIYYLGVIDCLTHYGMIKKIEHFWKGLSHDKTQISALPPTQYGERFFKFVEDVTLSPEEARRRDEAEEAARAARIAEEEQAGEELEGRGGICPSHQRSRGGGGAPPMPTHQPPRPPVGRLPPNAEVDEGEAHGEHGPLPVVDEAGEGAGQSEKRPATPRKDHPVRTVRSGRPATPPKCKPESADSGYGGNGPQEVATEKGPRDGEKVGMRPGTAGTGISRSSLEKALPPLPGEAR